MDQSTYKESDFFVCQLAEASVLFLRAATNANAVLIDGISDSPENRAIWREYAPPAYSILKEFNEVSSSRRPCGRTNAEATPEWKLRLLGSRPGSMLLQSLIIF